MCARIIRTLLDYGVLRTAVRSRPSPPVATLPEKPTGLLQGIAELPWSYAHRPPKYLSKMARIARPFTRLKWNEAVDAPFLAPLLSRRKAVDWLGES